MYAFRFVTKVSFFIYQSRNKLKYALTYREVSLILNDKEVNVKVDGKVRRDRGKFNLN